MPGRRFLLHVGRNLRGGSWVLGTHVDFDELLEDLSDLNEVGLVDGSHAKFKFT